MAARGMIPSDARANEEETLGARRRRLRARSTSKASIVDLPMEVVQDVLARAVARSPSGAIAAARLARVSTLFRDAIYRDPELFWIDIDMSSRSCAPTDARVKAMCERGTWKAARFINFAGCEKLTDEALRAVALGCPNLRDVVFSGGKFTKAGLEEFARRGGFRSVTLDLTSKALKPSDALVVLRAFIAHSHETLEKLSCGREAPYSPAERRAFSLASTQLFNGVKKCTNLKVLDFTNCGEDVRFPLYDIQRHCPHVEELKLNCFGGDPGWTIAGQAPPDFEDTCWRKLRVCEVAVAMETTSVGYRLGNSNVDDAALISILYGSIETIEVLDVTGCSHLGHWGAVVWDKLPINLKRLRCARTPLACDDAVRHILAHLCPALEDLEVSCIGAAAAQITDDAFLAFAPGTGPPLALRTLHVAGSGVTAKALRALCASCALARFPRLRAVDLSACRSLSRAVRRVAVDLFPNDNVRALERASL